MDPGAIIDAKNFVENITECRRDKLCAPKAVNSLKYGTGVVAWTKPKSVLLSIRKKLLSCKAFYWTNML